HLGLKVECLGLPHLSALCLFIDLLNRLKRSTNTQSAKGCGCSIFSRSFSHRRRDDFCDCLLLIAPYNL
ncbi:MAG: hypothetical protein RSB69_10865, partial [Odoribacter sp.]